jgi:hypothetical protein
MKRTMRTTTEAERAELDRLEALAQRDFPPLLVPPLWEGTTSPVPGVVECGRRYAMIQTVEAIVDVDGQIRLLGDLNVSGPCRALVTVLNEPAAAPGETALLSEATLAVDWNRPEEDAAWSHLQPERSS